MPGVGVVFEAAPPLKYAEDVVLNSPLGSTIGRHSEAFMSNFTGMKSLSLWLDDGAFRQMSWTFLRQECARELRLIKTTRSPASFENVSRSVVELVRCCVTVPRPLGGEPLELDFAENFFSGEIALRIIEVGT